MKQSSPHELQDLANQVGHFIQYWGFKSVHGRIWAHLFVSADGLDAGTLIRRLGVSKALVSMSLKDLMKYKVVRVVGKSTEGTVLYDANTDVTSVILNVLKIRERKIIERVATAFDNLCTLSAEDTAKHRLSAPRVEALGELIKTGRKTLDCFLNLSQADLRAWKKFNPIEI